MGHTNEYKWHTFDGTYMHTACHFTHLITQILIAEKSNKFFSIKRKQIKNVITTHNFGFS